MYKLLIVEDEKIERESLQSIIKNFDLPIDEVLTAENGEEGLLLYHEHRPDIILADINMPVMGGLDMIKNIRKKDSSVMCIVLTSYDYFSYAQKAIRLNVEDFVLKPADKELLRKSLTQAIEKLTKDKNTFHQTSSLVKKMNEMKAILESECFYAILTKQDEFRLLETFRMANYSVTSCTCIVFEEVENQSSHIFQLRSELEDMGYMCVQGNIHQQHILFIMSNHKMDTTDETIFLEILKKEWLQVYRYSIGSIQNELALFYQSYEDAKYNLNNDEHQDSKMSEEITNDEFVILAKEWAMRLMEENHDDIQSLIHELCQQFLYYDYEKVNYVMKCIISELVIEIKQKYQIEIKEADVPFEELKYDNHQNLAIIVSQTLHKILNPLKSIKYHNNSSIIKKSMAFIEKNYAKQISLNTLADELGVSPFYISKLFGKELGHNFTDVVNEIRIRKAKKLIRKDLSFKEVAYQVGFGSQSYFTKMFKKMVGLSPTEYRKLFP